MLYALLKISESFQNFANSLTSKNLIFFLFNYNPLDNLSISIIHSFSRWGEEMDDTSRTEWSKKCVLQLLP